MIRVAQLTWTSVIKQVGGYVKNGLAGNQYLGIQPGLIQKLERRLKIVRRVTKLYPYGTERSQLDINC